MFLTTISLAKLRCGVAALPDGERKPVSVSPSKRIIALFGPRILIFDVTAAEADAAIRARAKASGKAFGAPDSYVAAIAAAHGFTVATRDMSPFEAAVVRVINPWVKGRDDGASLDARVLPDRVSPADP